MSEHERIWLEPAPESDPEFGRQWCQDNVWGDKATEYVRADLVDAKIAAARKEALEAAAQVVEGFQVGRTMTGEDLKPRQYPSQTSVAIAAAIRRLAEEERK